MNTIKNSESTRMGILTLLGYLAGHRAAILALAAHPHAWVVGLVFVVGRICKGRK